MSFTDLSANGKISITLPSEWAARSLSFSLSLSLTHPYETTINHNSQGREARKEATNPFVRFFFFFWAYCIWRRFLFLKTKNKEVDHNPFHNTPFFCPFFYVFTPPTISFYMRQKEKENRAQRIETFPHPRPGSSRRSSFVLYLFLNLVALVFM